MKGRVSSTQAVPAISRWIHGVSSAKTCRNSAAIMAPPHRPPVFLMSPMSDLIRSAYASPSGSRQNFSPQMAAAD